MVSSQQSALGSITTVYVLLPWRGVMARLVFATVVLHPDTGGTVSPKMDFLHDVALIVQNP